VPLDLMTRAEKGSLATPKRRERALRPIEAGLVHRVVWSAKMPCRIPVKWAATSRWSRTKPTDCGRCRSPKGHSGVDFRIIQTFSKDLGMPSS
jgi:hypothetical protein